MTTLIEKMAPRYSWAQIEAAILRVPLARFSSPARAGASEDDGCKMARAQISDDIRRELVAESERSSSSASSQS